MSASKPLISESNYKKIVVIAALGYFVDIFDLIIFGIVREQSLRDLGYSGEELMNYGIEILNWQMAGMLFGGIFWGVIGDKFGRVKVLIFSILTYSTANILSGFVQDVEQYKMLRFIGGIGLAGELGAGVTLAIESMPKNIRGLGGAVIAGFGVLGAAAAEVVVNMVDWRNAYIIGGAMGLVLMCFRFSMTESKIFKDHKADNAPHGNFLALFSQRKLVVKYLYCIMIGIPIWFSIGLLTYFSPEFAKEMGVVGTVTAGAAIMWMYIGMAFGDVGSGFVSQYLKSRKKAVMIFMGVMATVAYTYTHAHGITAGQFYALISLLGVGAGYWALMAINASEQFGVNYRATAATSVPNFVRASVIPMTLLFKELKPDMGLIEAAMVVGVIVFSLGAFAAWKMQETFHKDLNFLEGESEEAGTKRIADNEEKRNNSKAA
ncbi:MAG: MFS transporter [Thalassospira sp.]|nr:MFS transporter [Thalassospira sp.]